MKPARGYAHLSSSSFMPSFVLAENEDKHNIPLLRRKLQELLYFELCSSSVVVLCPRQKVMFLGVSERQVSGRPRPTDVGQSNQ